MGTPSAGEMRNRISIQSVSYEKDAKGGKQKVVSPYLESIAAKIVNLSGNERSVTEHGGVRGEARSVFTIRYRPGISSTQHQILFKGIVYNIRHINNFAEGNRFLVITCDAGDANG